MFRVLYSNGQIIRFMNPKAVPRGRQQQSGNYASVAGGIFLIASNLYRSYYLNQEQYNTDTIVYRFTALILV